jgi:hypothetical protein
MPIGRRALWRTRWWLSTVMAVGLTTTGKIGGLGIATVIGSSSPAVALDFVWLSSVLDFVYAGALLGIAPAIHRVGSLQQGGGGRVIAAFATAAAVVVFAGGVLWPFALMYYERLPLAWIDVTGGVLWTLLIGLGLTVAGYFASPAPTPLPARPATGAAVVWRGPRKLPELPTVTGFGRLALRLFAASFALYAGVVVLILSVDAVANAVANAVMGASLLEDGDAGLFGLQPFGPGFESFHVFPLFILGTIGLASQGPWKADTLRQMLRHLRTLPLGTVRLNLSLIALPLACWCSLWLVLAGVHLITTEAFVSFRVPEFFAMAGMGAFARAQELLRQRQSNYWHYAFVIPTLWSLMAVDKLAPGWTTFAFVVIGATTGIAGAWLNQRALRRSHAAYAVTPGRAWGLLPTPER